MPSVFLSYSRQDEAWKDHLKKHLGVLEAQGLLDTWDDRRIEAGADWFEEIQDAMAQASVAVLLISADYLTSNFILGEEVPKLLERRSREGLHVIPVIVHACAWEQVKWLRPLQARPRDDRTLDSFREARRNQELTKIAQEILGILEREHGVRDSRHDREPRKREDDFLDRVEEVCRLHDPSAEVRRFPGVGDAGGYLRVIRRVGSMIREIYPIGAIEQDLSRKSFDAFLTEIDAHYRKTDPTLISHLVYGGPPPPEDLVQEAGTRRVHLVSFVEHQGLIDFRSYLKKQTDKLAADPIYPPRLYVPQRMQTVSIIGRKEEEATEDALRQVREWLGSPHGRFLVLLGDFGTGKTFLLHELARRMGEADGGLVPILLQMRSLEKGRLLDALLAQHFAQEGMDGFSPAKFRYMLEQGRIALLFDGFDELALRVTYDKAADHFATLLQAATGNAKVVLTSRRQHFISESQVKTALAQQVEILSGHRLAILQPFRREQVCHFLINYFEGDETKAEARLDLIDRVKDLLGLSSNPRLLGFIAELPAEDLATASRGGDITAAKLYELLLNRWLVYEFDRVHPKGAPPGLSVAERWQAVTLVAMRLWQKTDRFVSLSDLSEETARAVQAVGPAAPDADVATFQVGSGTLLVRDEEGNFAFLHQSILEWLVARNAAEAIAAGADPAALAVREISPLMADFLVNLAGRDAAVVWARGILRDSENETIKKNALLVLERQKEAIGGRLAGQDLRGKDFSGQDLSGADLSGADLTAARLAGARLTSARLMNVILREADLSRAILIKANLTDADLTGARLVGADLREARLTRACFRRARLVGAVLETESFETADAFGAALDLTELDPQGGTAGGYSAMAWSQDGELLASAAGRVVRLWETQSGRQIRTFTGHQDTVSSVAFSPDGKSLASGSYDNTVRLWQVATGRHIRDFTGHQSRVSSVIFSPDSKSLASGSYDYTVRLWQVDTGRHIRNFMGHRKTVSSVVFSPDGKSLASGSYDNTVRLWQVDTGRLIRDFKGHRNTVSSVAFSPDSKSLASGSNDNTVRLWQIDTGRLIRNFTGHQGMVSSVAFSPDGKNLASGSEDNTVRLWQIDTGRLIRGFTGHQSLVSSVAFSADGKSLASSSEDNTVRLWQVDSGQEIRAFAEHQNPVRSVAFSPDGKTLVGASDDNTVRLWQVDSGREIRTYSGHLKTVFSVAFSPDGKSFASGSYDKTVRLWKMDSRQEIRVFSGHQSWIASISFSPDGKMLASGSDDNTVRLWQVDGGREVRIFSGHQNRVLSVAFSPDGKSLADGSADDSVCLWNVDSGQRIRAFWGHQKPIFTVAFSPDGKNLASGSSDDTVRLWQVDSGREIRVLSGHQSTVTSVAFSPDGKSLASGSSDNTIRLWQVDTGRQIRSFSEYQSWVMSVAFSPDSKSLAGASSDGTIRLWNVADGRCLAVLLSLPEGWVAFSPDGRYKFGGVPAGGFWHVAKLCRFEIGELDEWVPGLRLADEASFFDLPPWKPEVRVPERKT